ncbi:hypothetical protein C1H76_5996 [Elsinoe australis]|uniref:Uncharacterized protein n=1 Tax=Elsinoe australis TaxID=40998 RepID=A0A4U7AXW3_9PEZI|nr:hypothetical protein C1H76_5996 [Elsinoe australis]
MCLACYPTTTLPTTLAPAPPPAAPPPAPVRSVRFSVPNAYESWSCYPSNQLQLIPPPPIVIPKPAAAPSKPSKAASEKAAPSILPSDKGDSAKEKKKPRPSAPPSLKAGATFVYPRKNTYVHLIKETKVWEEGKGKGGWSFKIHRVPVSLSVGEFVEAFMGEEAGGWSVTEVVELGDGEWDKGTSVKFGDGKAKETMGSFGWNERRGSDLPPVWLVLHKD